MIIAWLTQTGDGGWLAQFRGEDAQRDPASQTFETRDAARAWVEAEGKAMRATVQWI